MAQADFHLYTPEGYRGRTLVVDVPTRLQWTVTRSGVGAVLNSASIILKSPGATVTLTPEQSFPVADGAISVVVDPTDLATAAIKEVGQTGGVHFSAVAVDGANTEVIRELEPVFIRDYIPRPHINLADIAGISPELLDPESYPDESWTNWMPAFKWAERSFRNWLADQGGERRGNLLADMAQVSEVIWWMGALHIAELQVASLDGSSYWIGKIKTYSRRVASMKSRLLVDYTASAPSVWGSGTAPTQKLRRPAQAPAGSSRDRDGSFGLVM